VRRRAFRAILSDMTNTDPDPTVRRIEGTEVSRAIDTLTMAFAADPTMRWLWPESDVYLRSFPRLVAAFGGRAFQHAGAHADDGFGGVALWLPPGVTPDGDAVVALFRETVPQPRLDDALGMLDAMEEHTPEDAHWHLAFIGVDTSRQGEGLGGHVMREGVGMCDEEGVPGYLESSNPGNIPFYQRHGYEIVGEIQVGSSPVLTPMRRDRR